MNTDIQLIKQIRKKNSESAANTLVTKYYKELYRFHYKQTLDLELSMDLTQELFISILQSIHSYDPKKASFRTWLYRVASNRLVDHFRSKQFRYAQQTREMAGYLEDIADHYDMELDLEYKEQYELVNNLASQLPAQVQQVLRLKLFGDYKLQEIAEMEELPVSTVKTRYYTALKWLRKEMEAVTNERRKI